MVAGRQILMEDRDMLREKFSKWFGFDMSVETAYTLDCILASFGLILVGLLLIVFGLTPAFVTLFGLLALCVILLFWGVFGFDGEAFFVGSLFFVLTCLFFAVPHRGRPNSGKLKKHAPISAVQQKATAHKTHQIGGKKHAN